MQIINIESFSTCHPRWRRSYLKFGDHQAQKVRVLLSTRIHPCKRSKIILNVTVHADYLFDTVDPNSDDNQKLRKYATLLRGWPQVV